MSESWQIEYKGKLRVVSVTMDGNTCIYDSIKGLQDELALFWSEGVGAEDELVIRFYQMDKKTVEALPDFTGW